jgi:hypothetical protein
MTRCAGRYRSLGDGKAAMAGSVTRAFLLPLLRVWLL